MELETYRCNDLSIIKTDDGSLSLKNKLYQENFHCTSGAKKETFDKFINPLKLSNSSAHDRLNILDVCFGMGYNCGFLMKTILDTNTQVEWFGLEIDQRPLRICLENNFLNKDLPTEVIDILYSLSENGQWANTWSKGRLLWGDARSRIYDFSQSNYFDLILLDAFSPTKCPELWSQEFIDKLASLLNNRGRLITYSSAAAVRTSLRNAGLSIRSIRTDTVEKKRWSSGTLAIKIDIDGEDKELIERDMLLTLMEEEHLLTKASIPYRDPTLKDKSEVIITRRLREQSLSKMERTKDWKERWF